MESLPNFHFSSYFDAGFFLELIVTNALGVFHWISYIRYGFQVQLDFSKTGAGRSNCQLTTVVSCCTWPCPLLYLINLLLFMLRFISQ